MFTIQQTETFASWFSGLRDARAKARIIMRVYIGPGYRMYYTQRGKTILLLLCGGDKSTQPRDIKRAAVLAQELSP